MTGYNRSSLTNLELWKVWKREPVQFLLQSEEGIALDSISPNRAGFVIVAANTEELRAVGEIRKSIEVTR